jgi:hypothetical protein
MAVSTNPGVTIVPQADAPATIRAAVTNSKFNIKIAKIVLVAAAAAASATVTDGNDLEIGSLAAPIGSSDELDFHASKGFVANGLKVSAIAGAGAKLYIYGA